MTSATSNNFGNPLVGLPSILGLRDLRRRTRAFLCTQGSSGRWSAWSALLHVDPLAVVRGLRVANAPLYAYRPRRWTIASMIDRLGATLVPRLLDTPPAPTTDTQPLRQLWMHSLATAIAARELAAGGGAVDPEEAYLLGLVHDMAAWLAQIDELRGIATLVDDEQRRGWIRHWRLPERIEAAALQRSDPRTPPHTTDTADLGALLGRATRLATLADFPHPAHLDSRVALVAEADRGELVAAQQLRHSTQEALARIGLDAEPTAVESWANQGMTDDDLFLPGPVDAPLEEVILNVLSCRQSNSYRGIITALLAAALRYGSFDRVLYAKWVGGSRLVLRSKAESSARRMVATTVEPTAAEGAALRQSLVFERPVLIEGEPGVHAGLLGNLSIDQLLAVAVNREFETPAFLLFDRGARQLPIEVSSDSSIALTLGQTGSLLKENLLLRRRRERADQIALTDPLTRLYNRRMAVAALERELARCKRTGQPLTVLLCDLDHFKRLNDQFGHLVGDFALRSVAEVLRQTVRRSDVLCRFGGEEFLIVLPDTPPEDAAVLATRIFTQIAQRGDELRLPLTVSIGLTMVREADTPDTLIERADHALYASKGTGRNRFSVDLEGHAPIERLPAETP